MESLNWLARCAGVTRSRYVPCAPSGIGRMRQYSRYGRPEVGRMRRVPLELPATWSRAGRGGDRRNIDQGEAFRQSRSGRHRSPGEGKTDGAPGRELMVKYPVVLKILCAAFVGCLVLPLGG